MALLDRISHQVLGKSFFDPRPYGLHRQSPPEGQPLLREVSQGRLNRDFFFRGASTDLSVQSPPEERVRPGAVYQPVPPPPGDPSLGVRLDIMA